jgi:hypothetical protein
MYGRALVQAYLGDREGAADTIEANRHQVARGGQPNACVIESYPRTVMAGLALCSGDPGRSFLERSQIAWHAGRRRRR